MLVPDKKWNVVYIHVLCWRRNSDCIHVICGEDIWCVRESPDLISDGMCLSQIRSGMLPIFMFCARQSGGGTLTIFMWYA